MRFLKNLFVNSLIPLVSCGVIVKRGTGSIDDFSPYSDVKKDIEDNINNYSYNFYSIFKDGPIYTGDATAYGMATSGGNCLFPKDEFYQDMMYAALNSKQYLSDLGCGTCAVVVSTEQPYKPIRVRVIDRCPECKHGDLDLSNKAYKALTNEEPGRRKITWALIPCDIDIAGFKALVKPNSDIKFQFKSGSSASWTEVKVYNTRYPVAKMEVKVKDKYVRMTRRDYNYWYRKGELGLGDGPFDFRVVLADGSTIDATGVEMKVQENDEDSIYSTGKQKVTGATGKTGWFKRLIKTIFLTIVIVVIIALALYLSIFIFIKFQKHKMNTKSLPAIPTKKETINTNEL
ncbi:hypothetical protein H8356DRAFT_987191 [Neocallimastix lanati (nom. inval.)]|jgi:expansin (peptidoglycan-binding protein)|nr:hypothetical protein H8356DRAFT_987191 [Neocallimastix sp. JGI-2020a]